MSNVTIGARRAIVAAAAIVVVSSAPPALQAQLQHGRQALADAWWTGPMLAISAATLPRGHFLVEPYLYDVVTTGAYDNSGTRRHAPASHGLGSLTYIIYGITDRVELGAIPTAGYNVVHNGPTSSGVGLGDTRLFLQYGLTRFHETSRIPATAVALDESFPTGSYDRLGEPLVDGFGSGAYTTTLALYSQTYFWLPTGRLLRMRLDASQSFSSHVTVEDASVYGTQTDFRGRASPGSAVFIDLSAEYSLTRRWVLATDVTYRRARSTVVTGRYIADPTRAHRTPAAVLTSGPSDLVQLAPAIEYSWSSTAGVLLGVRVAAAGRNASATVTPAVAINIVR